ncbi:hypothetical protein EOK75_16675 (plasmid) [Pseudorhodobacter turbinis]|uniref:Uncharacterized protein n=1 Tax=Pseudorhodobacter turbinis TaxID=2500533 RepID=A0A4P8EK34_9RHOB|nr:hypothetical protein EOK75_16675 [Pseudorhodobacter turbinis]
MAEMICGSQDPGSYFHYRSSTYLTEFFEDCDLSFGPVALSCRSKCSFKPPFVQKRPDFSNPMLSGVVADCRSRVWMPLSMQEVFQIAWNK